MKHRKLYLNALLVLLVIKFIVFPWIDWVEEKEFAVSQLVSFYEKQEFAINNEKAIQAHLDNVETALSTLKKPMELLDKEKSANTLWFKLIDSLKSKNVKIYNQKVEIENLLTADVGYVTGRFFISGDATEVVKSILHLESNAPYVFLEQVNLNALKGAKSGELVAQLYVGYWFTHSKESTQ
ncbi:hypothetical protein tinsulaeT_09240 [Thalassotalea insulae]|uniref:Uncharacterized protein n=1 Tax=Thalassotalea insulae TaxID=2056778 RepID=A0ABQ6GQH2_9GAMM|nr:hypothetical protein [Thalassotalea insulae]GLX77584.1 hypothetical protein tinsulaeT_09240 [Thalassotalea insulae]